MSLNRFDFAGAWKKSVGPTSPKEAGILAAKGFCMGAADIIPGVSGGTIAFITGIYDQLVDAIRSFDIAFAKDVFKLNIAGAIARSHLKFLVFLLLGIGSAILGMARLMHYLLNVHPVEIWSLFFGLIAASVIVVGKRIGEFSPANILACFLGAAGSYLLTGMIPVQTPETMPFIYFCGAIAICAMILPGISGAFILLMLGKYEYVTGALKNPFLPDNLMIIGVFIAGAATGIVVFSRVLHYLLDRWHALTVSVLTGFMLGALRKVWPWKEILESTSIRGKVYVLREQNVMPDGFGGDFWLALGLMVLGAAAVLLLEYVSNSKVSAE